MPKAKQKEAETQTGATAGAVTETVQRIYPEKRRLPTR